MIFQVFVVDSASGRPVDGLPVRVERRYLNEWQTVWQGITDHNGRASSSWTSEETGSQVRMILETDRYFTTLGVRPFYSYIMVALANSECDQHIPVVLAPHCYLVCSVN